MTVNYIIMKNLSVIIILFPAFFMTIYLGSESITLSQDHNIKFRIVAFHDGESDQAHISFVK